MQCVPIAIAKRILFMLAIECNRSATVCLVRLGRYAEVYGGILGIEEGSPEGKLNNTTENLPSYPPAR